MEHAAVESRLLDIWRDVLGVSDLTIDSDFFDVGGHSLAAMRIVSRVWRTFDIEVDPGVVFDAPTVRAMSRKLV